MGKALKIGIAVVVVGGVVALYATGRLDKEETKQLARQAYYAGRGAAGAAKSKPITRGDTSTAGQCRENLKRIESGKRQAGRDRGNATGAVSVSEVEESLGGSLPKCPEGGRYTLRAMEYLPRCSIGIQGNTDKSDDHVILEF